MIRLTNAPGGNLLRIIYLDQAAGGSMSMAQAYPEFTELWDKILAEADGAKRTELFKQAYKIINDEMLGIPIANVDAISGVGKTVDEWTPTAGQVHLPRYETVTHAK